MAAAVGDQEAGLTLTWSGRGVDVQAIEASLAALRREAASIGPDEEGAFAIRTHVLNLVAYADDEALARHASEIIAGLEVQHPSRSLIVLAMPQEEGGIDAHLSAHCHPLGGVRRSEAGRVCCEEVLLVVRGEAARHLHSVIIPLLVSDLPVFLWWTGELPADAHLLEEMMATADRSIVDTGRWPSPERQLPQWHRVCQAHPDCAFGDLNWGRLRSWRRLLAQVFDRPTVRGYLGRLRAVEVRYGAQGLGQGGFVQALLMVGWLASRLGWEPRRRFIRRGRCLLELAGQRPVRVLIQPDGAPAEALASVRLEAEEASVTACVSAGPAPASATVTVEMSGERIEERVRLAPCSESDLLGRELQMVGRDSVFEGALMATVALLEGGEELAAPG